MVEFPDTSAQEEMIRVVGNVELLRKRGKKIVRFKKSTYGSEDDIPKYDKIKELFSGRVLNIGLGMGNSIDMILSRAEVTELIAYELEQDFIDLYNAEHPTPDPKLSLTLADAHAQKPTGDFDVVLYELEFGTRSLFNKAKTYLTWAWQHLKAGGSIVLPYSIYSAAAVVELSPPNAVTTFFSVPRGRLQENLFIRVKKPE